jgi:prepilin-type N-terminal cleavage/methylation domain-containing protein
MITNSRIHYCTNKQGFTLAEAMMAVVVLGIAAASVLLPFVSGAAVRAEGINRTLAARLASDLMEEIVSTPFDQIVDVYNGYYESQGQVKDAAGVVFVDPNYTRFSREVNCQYVYVPQESGAEEPKFIRVTVQMCYDGKQIATLHRLVSK